jgi:hypothetical protein
MECSANSMREKIKRYREKIKREGKQPPRDPSDKKEKAAAYTRAYRLRRGEPQRVYDRAQQKKRRTEKPEHERDKWLRRMYGVAPGEYHAKVKSQNGKCALCGNPPTERRPGWRLFHLDHCAKTLKVRELLCANCNLGLGNFKHDIGILEKAIAYLQKHS